MILSVVAIVISLASVGVNYFLLRPKAQNLAKAHIDSVYQMHEAKARVIRDDAKHCLREAEKLRNVSFEAATFAQQALARLSQDG